MTAAKATRANKQVRRWSPMKPLVGTRGGGGGKGHSEGGRVDRGAAGDALQLAAPVPVRLPPSHFASPQGKRSGVWEAGLCGLPRRDSRSCPAFALSEALEVLVEGDDGVAEGGDALSGWLFPQICFPSPLLRTLTSSSLAPRAHADTTVRQLHGFEI